MLVGKTISQIWTLGEEGLLKLSSFAHVTLGGGAPMHCDTAEKTEVVIVRVQRQHPMLVAKPIRETPKTEEQRVPVQDDLDIHRLGQLVGSFGVGTIRVGQSCLFLPANPFPRRHKSLEPR